MSKKNIKKSIQEVNKKKVNYKLLGILYIVCALCWIASAILNYNFDSNRYLYILDFVISFVWIVLAIIYFRKAKKEKNKK